MRILLENNKSFHLNEIPDTVDHIYYCVLDYSNPNTDVDFFQIPLIFMEQFPRPSAELMIGKYRIQMPLDWSVIIADKNLGLLEVMEIKHLNDRQFDAFVLNPSAYMPQFYDISINNIYPDVNWCVPKLKKGHILVVPLSDEPDPPCAYFVKETNKLHDSLDISRILS
jgi:hypothetical protein